ncbi:related to nitrogen metabolic regulation protein nmr [Rhynchosporium secalis]|uniref:Related to nitrogen metabolic regulation protein nmr n=1 Tax=Rhynchosporium secalis TaxID=38038 RepID=A0A1E1MC90_RHYSE|nr:related to nitrogen metabolic regulation protein nmr [Rhynchosporium secalis]
MSKLIVIIGVTGNQGSSVARTFLALPGWKVRGISRNPSSAASQNLSALGIEIVQGDVDDRCSLIPAFAGAHTIFANTDYFAPLFAAIGDPDLAAPQDGNAKRYAYDREVEQGVNIASVAASPAVLETLQRFIYSSLADATALSKGKYTEVYHFDSKAEVLRVIRDKYVEVAERMSMLQMGHFVENLSAFPSMAPVRGDDGTFVMRRPNAKETRWEWVVARRDTGVFVRALVEDLEAGKTLLGFSEAMTGLEFLAVWGKVLGVGTRYEEVSLEEFFAGLPAAMSEEMGDAFRFMEEFGHCGGDEEVLIPAQLEKKLKLTSVEEWIRGEDWSSILKV